ncbi:MAG: phospholipase D-like domain-containing protein [Gammaproteobacteria bacterium]
MGIRKLIALLLTLTACSCANFTDSANNCPAGTQSRENCPPLAAVADDDIRKLYEQRSWKKPSELDFDPVALGKEAKIEIKQARAKFIGTTDKDALNSLAAKISMIENAEHTIDLIYYIWRPDLVGKGMMGALCDAVERGVDIRFMVDGVGSLTLGTTDLRALESCRTNAGFMVNAAGQTTIYKARIQVVYFNALSKVTTSFNRRSHDKLLIVDGKFPAKAAMMTGGRNISLAYYSFKADGSEDPLVYRDAEILIRPGQQKNNAVRSIGTLTEDYYSLLFYFKGNRRLKVPSSQRPDLNYRQTLTQFRSSLSALKEIPELKARLDAMPDYLSSGYRNADVKLAHELGNLTAKRVVRNALENLDRNPNSIIGLLREIGDTNYTRLRIVSPYLFLARYEGDNGEVALDEAQRLLDWLNLNPQHKLEIVTNSVLTSNNAGAQAVIDMDTAPRLLMSEEMRKEWLNKPKQTEFNTEFIASEEWQAVANHPQISIYQNGLLDSTLLGGDTGYGNVHAKYIMTNNHGFVGTTNFDYRSRLYNNEMGYFFASDELLTDLDRDFEHLISRSYKWGSDEWLEMRRQLRESKGTKAGSAKNQRRNYKLLRSTGLKWWW